MDRTLCVALRRFVCSSARRSVPDQTREATVHPHRTSADWCTQHRCFVAGNRLRETTHWSRVPARPLRAVHPVLRSPVLWHRRTACRHDSQRWLEAAGFLLIPCIIPLETNLLEITAIHILLCVLVALGLALVRPDAFRLAPALLAFALYPTVGKIVNYPNMHNPDLDELSNWASGNTPQNAVFQFADIRRGADPGVFRARAERAIFADWKAGGQVNFLPDFARVWADRWKRVERPQPVSVYRDLNIDYVVFSAPKVPKGLAPVWSESKLGRCQHQRSLRTRSNKLKLPSMAEQVYDVCIVGSGPGGGIASYVLTKAGLKVALVEAGRRFRPGIDYGAHVDPYATLEKRLAGWFQKSDSQHFRRLFGNRSLYRRRR